MIRLLIAAFLFANVVTGAHADLDAWKFRVLLDDREIGHHSFVLRGGDGGESELHSEAKFDVRLLFISPYRYRHQATERMRDGCLQSLESHTKTNGKSQSVRTAVRGSRLVVQQPEKREEYGGCVMSFAYWNPQILSADRLLNSQTGELMPVTISSQGVETIQVRGKKISAQRHRLRAQQLTIDLWYVGDRWVALESPTEGGRRLRYELI